MDAGVIGITVIYVLAMIALIYDGYRIVTDTDIYEDVFFNILSILIALAMVVTFFLTLFD